MVPTVEPACARKPMLGPKNQAAWEPNFGPLKITLCYAILLPGRKSGVGPDIGRILIGKTSKSALQPTAGLPEADFEAFPI